MPAQQLRKFSEQETYLHIYNKGVGATVIFPDESDYQVFLNYLNDYLSEQSDIEAKKKDFTVKGRVFRGTPHLPKNYYRQVSLVAYSLLADHFHLLIREEIKGGATRFMKSLCTRYSIYFNKKYHKSGPLFDRSYKSAVIEGHRQLSHLIQYFHDSHGEVSYSSKEEFQQKRETSWLTPVEMIDIGEYKESDNPDLSLLKSVILEKRKHESASTLESSNIEADVQKLSRIPEFLTLTLIFAVLLGLSIYRVSSLQLAKASTAVLSAMSEPQVTPLPDESSLTPSVVPLEDRESEDMTLTLQASPGAALKSVLVVHASDSATMAPIYKSPSPDAELIGEAQNGDQFIITKQVDQWYEVLLSNGAAAYIATVSGLLK